MLKLRLKTGNTFVIARESTIELLSTEGYRAKIRIRSTDFCTVIFHSSAAQNQKAISFSDEEQTLLLPEGSFLHLSECTMLLRSVGPGAMICEFYAPRSVNIEKRKQAETDSHLP